MSLEKKIENKLNESLKNKDKDTFPTLRLIISAIKDAKIAKKIKDSNLKDPDIITILKKMIKQRNDSCEAYEKAKRTDLLKSEKKEIEVINEFLPKQLSEDDTKKNMRRGHKKSRSFFNERYGKSNGRTKIKIWRCFRFF